MSERNRRPVSGCKDATYPHYLLDGELHVPKHPVRDQPNAVEMMFINVLHHVYL